MSELSEVISKKCIEPNDNYTVEYSKSKKKIAVIYFSSNGIFFPDTVECFLDTIENKERYEWKKNMIKNAAKHIFIRDLKKSWYLNGINQHYNSIPKLLTLLRDLTTGYEIITIGSSAGGYAAVLFGALLQATMCMLFQHSFQLSI